MEHKQVEATILATDENQGIVEAVWAVMGNVDEGDDIIHPGAFSATFFMKGNKIKLLDNHRTDSVMSALGIIKELREVGPSELPQEIRDRYPEATGGAWGQFQFLLDTPEGKGAFSRIKSGAVKGWSFGYDAVQYDRSFEMVRGKKTPVRNLRQIRLHEISPVLFAMNEATTTTSAKSTPTEEKPWRAIREGDKWEVYKLDNDGKPTGASLGSHDSQEEAQQQVEALYASEDDDKGMKAGRVLNARNAARIKAAYDNLKEALEEAGLMEAIEEATLDDKSGPSKSEDTPTPDATGAGPNEDNNTRYLHLIELEQQKLQLLEV